MYLYFEGTNCTEMISRMNTRKEGRADGQNQFNVLPLSRKTGHISLKPTDVNKMNILLFDKCTFVA